jgi:hypothetical protein
LLDKSSSLWQFLDINQKDYITDSFYLLDHLKKSPVVLNDYSFILFGVAKCYEGFLKKLFLKKGYINEEQFLSTRYRIGKVLNPQLEDRYRDESVYDNMREETGDNNLGDLLWETWKFNRNRIFHYFPNKIDYLTIGECEKRIDDTVKTMEHTLKTLLSS